MVKKVKNSSQFLINVQHIKDLYCTLVVLTFANSELPLLTSLIIFATENLCNVTINKTNQK